MNTRRRATSLVLVAFTTSPATFTLSITVGKVPFQIADEALQ
jgi:hypothetical protein